MGSGAGGRNVQMEMHYPETGDRRSASRAKIAAGVVVLLLLIAVLATAGVYARTLLRAAAVLYSFSEKRPPLSVRLYERISLYPNQMKDQTVVGSVGQSIALRTYDPTGRRNPPTIVVLHGTAPDGNRTEALNHLAAALASQGFRVVLPTLPEEKKLDIAEGDVQVIADTIVWASQTGGGKQVSVFGVSFGGGLAIAAAEMPRAKKHVRLVLSISGFNDLNMIARYYTHEAVVGPSGRPYPKQGPYNGAILFLKQYLDEMVPAADVPAMQTAIARLIRELFVKDNFPVGAGDPALQDLTPEQKRLFIALELVNTPEVQQRYRALITRHHADFLRVSPASVLPQLDLPLYVLHATEDRDIPVGELEWAQAEVRPGSDSHFLITPWMRHASVENPVPTRERVRVGQFLAGVLERAQGR